MPWPRNADAIKPYLDWNQPSPPKVTTIIPVGGEGGQPISLPDWFPQVNLDEYNVLLDLKEVAS